MADLDKQSLRGFVAQVERDLPGEILRIREPVGTRLDVTSTVFELERMGKSPLVVFEKVEGHTMPVVTNVAGSRKLLALALGVTPQELPTAFRERCTRYTPVELVNRPEWHDVTIEGDDIDLTKLPIPLHFDIDAAPYITAGQLTARDPESGVDTTGFHRLMLKGRNRLGVSLHSRRRMWEFHRRAEAKGQNLPAAITLGIHPLHYMGSMVYAYPPNVRKFEIIGGLFRQPYPVARRGGPGPRRDHDRGRGAGERARAGRAVQRVHRLRLVPLDPERVRRKAPSHAPGRDLPQCRLRYVAGPHLGFLHHARGRNPQRAPPQPAQRQGGARAAQHLRRLHGLHLDEEDVGRRAAAGDHGGARHRVLHQVCDRGGRRRRRVRPRRRDVGGGDAR